MKNKVLSCIYPLVEHFPDAPISIQLIVNAGQCTESEVKSVFAELKTLGHLKRKHYFTHVYRLTAEGFDLVKNGHEAYNKTKASEGDAVVSE